MYYISHRGNLNGKIPERENSPDYILEALNKKFKVEVDIWFSDKSWYFGHDEPQYKINIKKILQLLHRYQLDIWFHCKNIEALNYLIELEKNKIYPLIYFWHQNDDYTITSRNHIWTYPGQKLCKNSICVLPENSNYTKKELKNCLAICSDYIEKYKVMV